MTDTWLYILASVLTATLIRVLPALFIRGRIRNRFIRSFLYYVPYVTLAVMTFPAITEATATPLTGLLAMIVGIAAAWCGLGLFPVSIICCAVVFVSEWIMGL